MQTPAPPKAVAVEVVAARPTETDSAAIAHLSARDSKALPGVTYLVKVRFEDMPKPTSMGWALYVKNVRIPKYWEYSDGIYFKVFDPQFFRDHQGEPLRFSHNETDFIDTGLKLSTPPAAARAAAKAIDLPLQEEALLGKASPATARKRPSAAKRPSATKRRKKPRGRA